MIDIINWLGNTTSDEQIQKSKELERKYSVDEILTMYPEVVGEDIFIKIIKWKLMFDAMRHHMCSKISNEVYDYIANAFALSSPENKTLIKQWIDNKISYTELCGQQTFINFISTDKILMKMSQLYYIMEVDNDRDPD